MTSLSRIYSLTPFESAFFPCGRSFVQQATSLCKDAESVGKLITGLIQSAQSCKNG